MNPWRRLYRVHATMSFTPLFQEFSLHGRKRARARLRPRSGPDREAVRQRLDSAPGVEGCHRTGLGDLDGLDFAGRCPGRRRLSARPHQRDLRAGVVRQDHHRAAGGRGSAEEGRHRRIHRRGARARPGLCAETRRGCGQSAGFAARLRRAGARDHVAPDRFRADRRAGGGFGGGAGAQGRTGRRDGRQPHGRAGAADVAGAAQTDRRRSASRGPA